MTFLVDAQLPGSLVAALRVLGHEAVHVSEANLLQGKDHELWDYALAKQAVIVSKDGDFADMITRGRVGVSVVWLRLGNCPNKHLLETFTAILPQVLERLEGGERLIEVL